MLDICLRLLTNTGTRDFPEEGRYELDRALWSKRAEEWSRGTGIRGQRNLPGRGSACGATPRLIHTTPTQLEYLQNIVELAMYVSNYVDRPFKRQQVAFLCQRLTEASAYLS